MLAIKQSFCNKSKILSSGFILKFLYETSLLSTFKFLEDYSKYLIFLALVNTLEMYSPSKFSACLLTPLSKSLFISFFISFLKGFFIWNWHWIKFYMKICQSIHSYFVASDLKPFFGIIFRISWNNSVFTWLGASIW